MLELFPCPNPKCQHWNPPGRDACHACEQDLKGVDVKKALRASRPGRGGGLVWGAVILVAALAALAWWWQGRRAAQADTDAPILTILEPTESPARTAGAPVTVRGRVEDAHPDSVTAGDVTAKVEDGLFTLQLPPPGDGGTVEIVAVDRAGNRSAPHALEILVDRDAPEIARLEPEDGATVVLPGLRLRGEAAEPLASITVNGQPGEVDGPAFTADVDLQEGTNTLLIVLTDLAGNPTERSLSVNHQARRLPAGLSASGRTATGHEIFTAAKDGAKLVLIPEATYRRGDDQGDADERPVREITVSSFFVQLGPVTNAQYARFVEATDATAPPAPDWDRDYLTSSPDHPVVNVSWTEARAYAEWAGRTLPTEAQWELAARGPESLRWPWGNDPADAATRYNGQGGEDGHEHASPVGAFPSGASPLGVLDMAGNVWEWTADRYSASYFRSAPATDPPGPNGGSERSLRGGAYTSAPKDARCGNRYKRREGDRRPNVGFRTAAAFPR